MNEELIVQALDRSCQEPSLCFQVIQEASYLHIFINRETESHPDYAKLTDNICSAIDKLDIPNLQGLCIYSRVLGNVESDWEKTIEIAKQAEALSEMPSPSQEILQPQKAIEENSVAEAEVVELSQYCFIRNKLMLTADLVPPSEEIARLIKSFHDMSDRSKHLVLPVLEPFFKTNTRPVTEQFPDEVQQWLEQLYGLDSRKASTWLSRYCFSPEATMAKIAAILGLPAPVVDSPPPESVEEQKVLENPAKQTPADNSLVTTKPSVKATYPLRQNQDEVLSAPPKTSTKKALTAKQRLLLPIAWTVCTLIFIVLGIVFASVPRSTSISPVCQNSGSQSYCQLGLQLVGEETFENIAKQTTPITPEAQERSLAICEQFGNLQAGKSLQEIRNSRIPVLYSHGEEVLPGIYVADVEQNNFQQEQGKSLTVRTACAFSNANAQIKMLASDTIPNDWPEKPYVGKLKTDLAAALGLFFIFIVLGTNTIFNALGIFIASVLNLGFRVYSLETLYQAAFFLGLIEMFVSFIFNSGLLIGIPLETIALLVTSFIVKGLKIDWAAGYKVVAFGAIVIIILKTILHFLLFAGIASILLYTLN